MLLLMALGTEPQICPPPTLLTVVHQNLGISKAKYPIWGLGISHVSCCPGKISSLGEAPSSLRNLSESIKVILGYKTQNPSPQQEGSTLPRHQHALPSAIIADKNGRTMQHKNSFKLFSHPKLSTGMIRVSIRGRKVTHFSKTYLPPSFTHPHQPSSRILVICHPFHAVPRHFLSQPG